VRGDDAELAVVASELARSAKTIVDLYTDPGSFHIPHNGRAKHARRSHDLLLLIGNRKLCRHIVSSAPGTAILIFQRVSECQKYYLPLRQFVTNISTEAILNADSILYHEDEGYRSGLLGYVKPFSVAVFGDYRLVEGLGSNFGSPFDLHYKVVDAWNATQLQAYCRAVLITLRSYLAIGAWGEHSFALSRAFSNIKSAFSDAYKLDDPQTPYFPSDVFSRLDAAIHFVREAVEELGKIDPLPVASDLRRRSDRRVLLTDLYDEIADLMFKLVLAASHIKTDQSRSWSIQYNTVWTFFFSPFSESKAWEVVQFKLRRLIFDEITHMDFLNYQSARVLGLSLNVLGFKSWAGQSRAERALQCAIISWTKKHFVSRWNDNPDVAGSGLPAGLSYDADNHRFIKTYERGLEREAPKDYLDLDVQRPRSSRPKPVRRRTPS
jgi:hypothetical protein